MAQVMTLTDSSPGGESISFYDGNEALVLDQPSGLGSPTDDQRTIELSVLIGDTAGSLTKDQVMALAARVNRILGRAVMARTRGLGRIVTLTHQPEGMTVPTIWTVWGGTLELPPEALFKFIYQGRLFPTLRLFVERRASSAEITVINGSGSVHGLAPVSHVFLNPAGGGTFGANTAGLVDGSLWQTTKFTLTPTIGTPANGDILYFGNIWAAAATDWDRVIMGLSTAGAGTYTFTWEYWNGSAWTAFTPTTNDFKTTRDFDTARSLGQIIFPILTGWAKTTINSVNAYWVRARISAFTSMTTIPVRTNGPVGSLFGCVALPATGANSVKGDTQADALVHLKNLSATAMAGVKAAMLTGQMAPPGLTVPVKPPLIFPFAAANLSVSGGDNGLAVEADANAPYLERVKVTIGGGGIATVSDRAQHFSGTQYVTVTPSGGDKITGWGIDDAFFSEHMVYFESLPSSYITLAGQWDETGNLRKWWLGVRNRKLTFMWQTSGGRRYTCTGTSILTTGQWYLLAGEFRQDQAEGRVYVNASKETEVNSSRSGDDVLSGNGTVPYRIGKTVSLTGEVGLVGRISWSWTVNTSIKNVFGGDTDDYFVPPVKRNPAAISPSSVYYEYDDYLATAQVLDTGGGTVKHGTRTTAPVNTNDAANALPGYFVGASVVGSGVKLIGMSVATTLGEEYAGPYRAFITVAPPSTGFSSTSKLELSSQWNVGDNALPFARAGMRLPSTHDVLGINSGYHLLWVGDVYLPPEGFYQGYRGSGSTPNAMQFYLFLHHDLSLGSTFWLGELYLYPIDGFIGEYQTFRQTYDASKLLAQNAGVSFDSRGPGPAIIAQSKTDGYLDQDRNAYAFAKGSPPKLYPQRSAWIVGQALRGYDASDVDYLYVRAIAGDALQPRIIARPLYDHWAAP